MLKSAHFCPSFNHPLISISFNLLDCCDWLNVSTRNTFSYSHSTYFLFSMIFIHVFKFFEFDFIIDWIVYTHCQMFPFIFTEWLALVSCPWHIDLFELQCSRELYVFVFQNFIIFVFMVEYWQFTQFLINFFLSWLLLQLGEVRVYGELNAIFEFSLFHNPCWYSNFIDIIVTRKDRK